jgi:hypothetical protein
VAGAIPNAGSPILAWVTVTIANPSVIDPPELNPVSAGISPASAAIR